MAEKYVKTIKLVGGLLEGKLLSSDEVKSLSKSKSKPELLGDVVGLMRGPGSRIAGALDTPRPPAGWHNIDFLDPREGPDPARALDIVFLIARISSDDWVLENLLKNAVNAIENAGNIKVEISGSKTKKQVSTTKALLESNFNTTKDAVSLAYFHHN